MFGKSSAEQKANKIAQLSVQYIGSGTAGATTSAGVAPVEIRRGLCPPWKCHKGAQAGLCVQEKRGK